jgi:hypothetical protein
MSNAMHGVPVVRAMSQSFGIMLLLLTCGVLSAQNVSGEIPAGHCHDCEFFRQESCLPQVKERRKQFPLRHVSGRSENREGAGFGNALVLPGLLDRPQPRGDSHIGLSCFLATSDPGQRAADQNDL